MLESLLLFFFLMSLVAIVFSPLLYFVWKKKTHKDETETHYSKISWRKGLIYALPLASALILIIVVKPTLGIRFGALEWFITFSALSFLFSKTKKIQLRKREGGFSFYLIEKTKTENDRVLSMKK